MYCYVMLCYVLVCTVMLCYVLLCTVMYCSTVMYSGTYSSTVRSVVDYSSTVEYTVLGVLVLVQSNSTSTSRVWYSKVQFNTEKYI